MSVLTIALTTALTAVLSATSVLAAVAGDIPDPDDVKPGRTGFLVVVFLVVALVVLLLSFRKQLRKTDRHFLGDGDRGPAPGEEDTSASGPENFHGDHDHPDEPGSPRTI